MLLFGEHRICHYTARGRCVSLLDQFRGVQQLKRDWIIDPCVHEISPILKKAQSHKYEKWSTGKKKKRPPGPRTAAPFRGIFLANGRPGEAASQRSGKSQ